MIEPAVQRASQLPEGVGAPIRLGGDMSIIVIYGHTRVRCALCNRPHRLDSLAAAPDKGGRLGCSHCGALSAVRRAPPWLKLVGPGTTLVVGEALDGFLADPLPWYLVRIQTTASDRPPPLREDTAPDVECPPEIRGALSVVLTRAPHEVGVTDQVRLEGTVELDITDLEPTALERMDTGEYLVG